MLDIILKILCILGIVLLILLGIVLVTLFLLLFFPVSYRLQGKKNSQELTALAKVSWLFGFLRLRYCYPEPGSMVVKLLCFTVFDSKKSGKKKKAEEENGSAKSKTKDKGRTGTKADEPGQIAEEANSEEGTNVVRNVAEAENTTVSEKTPDASETAENVTFASEEGILGRIIAKYDKIRYTILKIYDKIKHIMDNITFYKELLQEEQTKELFKHAIFRLGHIWKNVHPRKLNCDIIFGADSPDTTGYALAAYGMLSPRLGNHINITPDFTQAIFEGELYVAGYITIFQVIFHGARLALDKRLQLLIKKIKAHNKVSADKT